MSARDSGSAPGGFQHAALIVDSDDTLGRLLVPVLEANLAAGKPVLMVVGRHTEPVVRGALGARADDLEWRAPDAFYRRLGLAFESFRQYLQQQHAAGRSVHVVAEPDVASDPEAPVDRAAAYLTYESICNEAYAAYGCAVTCVWDSRRHPTLVIENVRSLHDHEITDAGPRPNPWYVGPTQYLQGRAGVEMPPPPATVDIGVALLDVDDLSQVRSAVAEWSREGGFADRAIGDVVTAVSEVATNALMHGAPPVRLRGWRHGQTLVVQVGDAGGRPIPPDAGYRHPGDSAGRGLGLWLARQMADLLTTHTVAGRTSVRLYFPYAVMHQHTGVP